MKKVDEGVELFDEIWEKVYSAEQQNQKEKYEMDLKKEIKKLQRQRDQIKTWISSSEVKDKDPLIEARKLIESKMEKFKICEKETKTKTYSKEGLAREEKLDPEDEAKLNTTSWIGDYIEKFNQELEEKEFEIEKLSSGKGKKSNKAALEALTQHTANHKFHISKLEGIIRLVNNDRLDVEVVDPLKDDLDYYLESYEDDDYAAAYDEDYFYEALGLDDLDIVNVDRVTQAAESKPSKKSDETTSLSSKGSKERSRGKKSAMSSVIPLTIGRARSKQEKEKADKNSKDKDNEEPSKSTPSKGSRSSKLEPKSSVPAPTTTTTTSQPPGTSMAAVLKRESEQQEKERQQKLAREQQAKAQAAEQLRIQQQQAALAQKQQQDALRQQQEAARLKQQQEAQRQQQKQQQISANSNDAAKQEQGAAQQLPSSLQAPGSHLQQASQAATPSSVADNQAQKDAMMAIPLAKTANTAPGSSQSVASTGSGTGAGMAPGATSINNSTIDILTAGLGGLGLGNAPGDASTAGASQGGANAVVGNVESLRGGLAPGAASGLGPGAAPGSSALVSALGDSFTAVPNTVDHERAAGSGGYAPQNPYPTPASFPTTPSPIFDKPAVFEKLGTDALFFIFYYAQGSYQQYLAARELKKQSWRFHKKYMTWFQRHEEPQITTDEYEQGTYVYFDYETGWCTRIKQDFRFEYSYLEDSLQ